MASNENDPRSRPASISSAEDIIARVKAELAAIDERVFQGLGAASLDEHLGDLRHAARGLFGNRNG